MTRRQPVRFKECEECGATYAISNTHQRFCSRACGQRAWVRTAPPGYRSAATKKSLEASAERRQRRSEYMRSYRQRPEVKARADELRRARYRAGYSETSKARQRARRQSYVVAHTHEEWLAKLDEFHHRCAYCRRSDRSLTKDHITPISAGDPMLVDRIENIVPACQSCNSTKSAKVLDRDGLEIFTRGRMITALVAAGQMLLDRRTRKTGEEILLAFGMVKTA